MDAGQVEQLESFLQRLENLLPPEQTRAYLGKRGNTPRVGVIYGEYENHAAAQRALTSLPAEVLNNQPYLRQVRKLK
jgi:septal ring-binding cell division protein DamX